MKRNKNELTLKDYKALYESLYPQLCVYAYQYLNDLEISKDIVQDQFIKAWEDNITFLNKNHTTRYFYKAIKDTCLNYLKSKAYKGTEPYVLANLEAYKTEAFFMPETIVIENALNTLPDKTAKVIRLSIEDYTNN